MVVGGRTVVSSVSKILTGTPSNLPALTAQLRALGGRYPGATFDRYYDLVPTISAAAHVFPTAAVIGDVRIAEDVSVWYGCVIRGDINYVQIGCVRACPRGLQRCGVDIHGAFMAFLLNHPGFCTILKSSYEVMQQCRTVRDPLAVVLPHRLVV